MRHVPDLPTGDLPAALVRLLGSLRRARGFDPEEYIEAKTTLLNQYMAQHGLDQVVVALSGGLDSATVAALVAAAQARPESPIERVVAVLLPVRGTSGATGQDEAARKGRLVAEQLGLTCVEIDLGATHAALTAAADGAVGLDGQGWAAGQAVSYLRTPALYYVTSLLAQAGGHPFVVGTSNLDEGGYLGYFGKSADGMVDVQLISDLHKSQVTAVACALDVPAEITQAPPTGDMFDGRVDAEVFGAPYDFVELYLNHLRDSDEQREVTLAALDTEALVTFRSMAENLDALHRYNSHKYLAASPAVHLDLFDVAVPGGWQFRTWVPPDPDLVASKFVGWTDAAELEQTMTPQGPRRRRVSFDGEVASVAEVLSHDELSAVAALVLGWQPVGVDGIAAHFGPGDDIGSYRATVFSTALADELFDRLAGAVACHDLGPWRPVGINPALRFIRYPADGKVIAHYDGPFRWHPRRQTALSVVIYLDGDAPTRFLHDAQTALPERERDHRDWVRCGHREEVRKLCHPGPGGALLFPHRVLHDCLPGQTKTVLRTDVIFER